MYVIVAVVVTTSECFYFLPVLMGRLKPRLHQHQQQCQSKTLDFVAKMAAMMTETYRLTWHEQKCL